jgi:peptidoglycan hydrolase CwlO-like protein
MTQAKDTDIRELKDLILGLDKKIDGLDKKIDEVKVDLKIVDTRLVEVEKKIDKQDTRLWTFGGIILAAALGTIVKLLSLPV